MSNINHWCVVCGTGYYACNSCSEVKHLRPWKTLADSVEHYQIFHVVTDYKNKKIDKDTAKGMLENIGTKGYRKWKPDIVTIIDEIMVEKPKVIKREKEEENTNAGITTPETV